MDSWLKTHERVVITFLILLVVGYLGNRWINFDAAKKDAQYQALAAEVAKDKQAQDALAVQSASDIAKYQQTLDTLQKQNAALLTTIQSDNALLKRQQTADATLPLPELAQRWETLAGIQSGLTATPAGVLSTPEAAVQTVQTLEKVPVLTDELAKEEGIAQNNAQMLNSAQSVNSDLTKQINSANILLVANDKACQASVSDLKAKQRKKSRNWFIRGAIVGATAVGYLVLHF
jgi:hypothetical protein